jgi:hypothetical protein
MRITEIWEHTIPILPQSPGIGFELNDNVMRAFKTAFA